MLNPSHVSGASGLFEGDEDGNQSVSGLVVGFIKGELSVVDLLVLSGRCCLDFLLRGIK